MNKVQVLKATIEKLESAEYEYDWWTTDKCNCGVVAKTLLNGERPNKNGAYEFATIHNGDVCGFHGLYEHAIKYCSRTGIRLPKVFDELKKCGFTVDELTKLERCGVTKSELVAYLKEWVKILESKGTQPQPPKVIIKYVSVLETIKDQLKELILS